MTTSQNSVSKMGLKTPELLSSKAFIGGRWVGSSNLIQVLNPADNTILGEVPDVGRKGASEAIGAAYQAQYEWRALTAGRRSEFLRRMAELMTENVEDLSRILTAEQGKPLAEARIEVAYAAAYLRWYSEEARRVLGHMLTPHESDKRLAVKREPIGVVAAITPWNFPLAMIARKIGPALAVGCTAVVKPSELTPLSALALARLGEEAGIPPGVLNIITGMPIDIGEVLTSDDRIRKLSFTGSTMVGKALAARCMHTVKRISLELGGNAPFIVFEDADIEAAVTGVLASKFRNSGQTCVCANRILVQSSVYDRFSDLLTERVAGLTVGPGLEGLTDQGPLINDLAVDKVEAHVNDAISKGGSIQTGGSRIDRCGSFFAPTVITDVSTDALICREETFGPVAGLIRFEDEGEALALANQTEAGLAAYFYTQNLSRSIRVSEALEYGMVGINSGSISTEVAPFGGIKQSGMGREGSHLGLDDYLNLKLVCTGI